MLALRRRRNGWFRLGPLKSLNTLLNGTTNHVNLEQIKSFVEKQIYELFQFSFTGNISITLSSPKHTKALSIIMVFVIIENASIDQFASTATILMRFGLSKTRTFESDRIARCDVSWTLCACYRHARL